MDILIKTSLCLSLVCVVTIPAVLSKEAQICIGSNSVLLSCTEDGGGVIQIENSRIGFMDQNAGYDDNNNWVCKPCCTEESCFFHPPDNLAGIKGICDGKPVCAIQQHRAMWTNPCRPGSSARKTNLHTVTYTCIQPDNKQYGSTVVKSSDNTTGCGRSSTISCPGEITIESVLWGRGGRGEQVGQCMVDYDICPLQAEPGKVSLIEDRCNGRSSCSVNYDVPFETVCGNGALDAAQIFYSCSDSPLTTAATTPAVTTTTTATTTTAKPPSPTPTQPTPATTTAAVTPPKLSTVSSMLPTTTTTKAPFTSKARGNGTTTPGGGANGTTTPDGGVTVVSHTTEGLPSNTTVEAVIKESNSGLPIVVIISVVIIAVVLLQICILIIWGCRRRGKSKKEKVAKTDEESPSAPKHFYSGSDVGDTFAPAKNSEQTYEQIDDHTDNASDRALVEDVYVKPQKDESLLFNKAPSVTYDETHSGSPNDDYNNVYSETPTKDLHETTNHHDAYNAAPTENTRETDHDDYNAAQYAHVGGTNITADQTLNVTHSETQSDDDNHEVREINDKHSGDHDNSITTHDAGKDETASHDLSPRHAIHSYHSNEKASLLDPDDDIAEDDLIRQEIDMVMLEDNEMREVHRKKGKKTKEEKKREKEQKQIEKAENLRAEKERKEKEKKEKKEKKEREKREKDFSSQDSMGALVPEGTQSTKSNKSPKKEKYKKVKKPKKEKDKASKVFEMGAIPLDTGNIEDSRHIEDDVEREPEKDTFVDVEDPVTTSGEEPAYDTGYMPHLGSAEHRTDGDGMDNQAYDHQAPEEAVIESYQSEQQQHNEPEAYQPDQEPDTLDVNPDFPEPSNDHDDMGPPYGETPAPDVPGEQYYGNDSDTGHTENDNQNRFSEDGQNSDTGANYMAGEDDVSNTGNYNDISNNNNHDDVSNNDEHDDIINNDDHDDISNNGDMGDITETPNKVVMRRTLHEDGDADKQPGKFSMRTSYNNMGASELPPVLGQSTPSGSETGGSETGEGAGYTRKQSLAIPKPPTVPGDTNYKHEKQTLINEIANVAKSLKRTPNAPPEEGQSTGGGSQTSEGWENNVTWNLDGKDPVSSSMEDIAPGSRAAVSGEPYD